MSSLNASATVSTNESTEIRTRTQTTCYLCGEEGDYLYQGFSDRLFYAPGTWSLRRCSNADCQLVWLDPQPEVIDIPKLYAGYYTGAVADAPSSIRKWIKNSVLATHLGYTEWCSPARWLAGSLIGLVPTLREMAAATVMYLPAGWRGRVLDVGCGNGYLLRNLKELGWNVFGVDPDPKAVAATKHVLGPVAQVGEVDSVSVPLALDVITMNHVIEHLPDPIATLQQCWSRLRPRGRLVIQTPNSESWGARLFKRSWIGWDPPRHLFLFSPLTLCQMVNRTGFKVEKVRTTARDARFVWTMSRAIKRGDDTRELFGCARSGLVNTLTSGLFQVLESLACAGDHEEIVLTAYRP